MASRKPSKKAPAKAGAIPLVRFKFGKDDDGVLPLSEVEEQLHRQYHKMAESDSPGLREVGKRKLREVAERTSAEIMRRLGASKGGSTKPKPDWHDKCAAYAKKLLATGTERHELVSKCRRRFDYDAKTIRTVLKNAGVK